MYTASIDIGTTNIKMNLFNGDFDVVDTVKYPYLNLHKTDEIFEMDFEEIWRTIYTGLNQFIKEHTLRHLEVVLTTAMHSVQLMENEYTLSGPLIVWADKRGTEAIQSMTQEQLKQQYYRTGTPIHSMNPFFKLLDLKGNLSQTKRVGSMKDVLFYRFTGEWAVDRGNASSSGLYNLEESKWDRESLNRLGISDSQLPMIKEASYHRPAKSSLFDATISVYIGTSDGISSNYVFNDLADVAVLSIGTSHAVRVLHHKVKLNKAVQNFAYAIHCDRYLIGLPSNNGADVLSWTNKLFNSTFAELNKVAMKRPKTETLFLPFINGERAPIWQEHATGNLSSLSRMTTRDSILFSILLGTIFNIKQNMEHLSEMVEFKSIGLVGGVTNLTALPQLIADVLGYPLYIPIIKNPETLGSISVVKGIKFKNDYQIVYPNKQCTYDEMYGEYLKLVERHCTN